MTTTVIVPPIRPNSIPEDRFAQNGDVPDQAALRRCAWAYNHASVHQRKVVFARYYDTQGTYTPATAAETTVYFSFRTGSNIEDLVFFFGLAPATQTNGTNKAHCQAKIFDGTTTISAPEVYYPRVQSGAFQPSEVAWSRVRITTADGLAPNTDYCGFVNQLHYSRLAALVIHEGADTTAVSSVTGVADPMAFEVNKPITDAACQNLAETGTELWQHNARQILSIGRDDSTSRFTVNSTTYTNIHSSDTAWSASSPGYVINTQYHDTQKGDVPVELAIRCTRTGGAGDLNVRFVQDGATLFTQSLTASVTPHATATFTIPAHTSRKTDILMSCDSGATFVVDCIGLWEYEA